MIDKDLYEKVWTAGNSLYDRNWEEHCDRIASAATVLLENGQTDGVHHKQWVIDQALRMLLDEKAYEELTDENWEKGLAP